MDAFDVDPTNFASTSLACGAIAIDPDEPDRIYVGTGEGDTHMLFNRRLTNGLPAYRGIGPIRSDDGGQSWVREPEHGESPLAGEAFFALAVRRTHSGSPPSASRRWNRPTVVGPPYNPAAPAEAQIVALAAGNQIYLSRNFGKTWGSTLDLPTEGGVYSLTFASATRFYAGTTAGEVFRFDKSGSTWKHTRVDDVPAGPLGVVGLVSDIGIDWSDASRASIYIALGGTGEFRHVWHFDGVSWEARSGQAGSGSELLDVEHNALAVDRDAPDHLYVGADIGVWHSPDRGQTWEPMPNGLPDAPVFDLQIHPTRRLLRAATHGRGMFEFPLVQ